MLGLCTAGGEKTKSFQSFKDEISGLNNKMISIEKQTEEWKENSEVRNTRFDYTVEQSFAV